MSGSIRRTRWLFVALAALSMSFFSTTSPVALGKVFQIDFPQFETSLPYGQDPTPVPIDLQTPLVQLASVTLELSGTDYEGWFVGDQVENFYDGPSPGALVGTINSRAINSIGPWPPIWYSTYWGIDNGAFSTTLTVYPGSGESDWSFMKDGVTDFTLANETLVGWGGFTTLPAFNLTQVTLLIDATPASSGDANGDGNVDINDLTIVLTNYDKSGMIWSQGDFNHDGTVDINDLTIVLTNYDTTSGKGIKAVPEPSCVVLLGIGALALVLFRRRK